MLDGEAVPDQVAAAFEKFTPADRATLSETRGLILTEAVRLDVGPVSESLKWGQPSYVVKTGTPLRLGLLGGAPAIFVHCQTHIIEAAREIFGGAAEFSGNRALVLGGDVRAVSHVIGAALTYHRRGA